MKTIPHMLKWLLPVAGLGAAVLVSAFFRGRPDAGFVAHEWGTFTSVQGGDGALLGWRPLETSRLPKFVYDWTRPRLRRQPAAQQAFGKGGLITLQRMETPVIYFYADRERTVDVTVRFPQGLITEWYPQTDRIGPSTVPVPRLVARLAEYAHKAGVKPAPRGLVRVMVGRAEVVPPALERELSAALAKAGQGDGQAQAAVRDEFQRLGRFAEPAWRLACHGLAPSAAQAGWMLLQARPQSAVTIR